MAATRENAESPAPLIAPGRDRAVHRWRRPPEFKPGLTHAARISVTGVDVDCLPSKSSRGDVSWVPAPGEDEVGTFDIILSRLPTSAFDWPGRAMMATKPVFQSSRLPTGEVVWVLWRTENTTPDFWAYRARALEQHSPAAGKQDSLDNPSDSNRVLLGGEFNGAALILDVSAAAAASERLRFKQYLWRPRTATDEFDDLATRQLARDEGSIVFEYTLNEPITDPPPFPVPIIRTPTTAEVPARVEVKPHFGLMFARGSDAVEVDLSSLQGGRSLLLILTWSCDALTLTVGARDIDVGPVTAKSGEDGTAAVA